MEPDVAAMPRGECELLYGRAGYLYALLAAREAITDEAAVAASVVWRLADAVAAAGAHAADARGLGASWGLVYAWHGSAYLGAGHGIAGILQILSDCQRTAAWAPAPAVAHRMRLAAAALAATVTCDGSLPTRIGGGKACLVQWCHGPPGLLLLGAAAEASPHGVLQGAMDRGRLDAAAERVWRAGLLRKGLGLCHGIAGNAYALLAHWRATGDAAWLRRAAAFAAFGAEHVAALEGVPDHPHSLYEGLAGFGCLLCDLLGGQPQLARMPGAE